MTTQASSPDPEPGRDVDRVRSRLGRSAELWTGRRSVSVDADGWTALSGARSVDYNVVMCAGDGDALDAGVERLLAAGVPGVVMVAGRALAEAQRLVARDWVCIGATPVMVRALGTGDAAASPPPGTDVLRGVRADAARTLLADAFEVSPELAQVALPDPGPDDEHRLWGAADADGSLRSCLAAVRVEDSVAIWSMATDATARRSGFGARALRAVLGDAARRGARDSILYASPAGEPFYRALGYRELERWQMWSRPRWVLGRA